MNRATVVIILAPLGIPARRILERLEGYKRGETELLELSDALFDDAESYLRFVRMTRVEQRARWRNACDDIERRIAASAKGTIAVVVAGHYFAFRECFSVVDLSRLAHIRPARVLTFIDDVYDVVARVKAHAMLVQDDRESFSLVDAIAWRREELLLGDFIATFANTHAASDGRSEVMVSEVNHFAVAVKHAPGLLERLLSDGASVPYLSFPISRTRTAPELFETVQRHRQKVYESLPEAAFDPVTIDERRFSPRESVRPATLLPRWDVLPIRPALEGVFDCERLFGIDELSAAKPLVMGDLRSRAYRYVQQSELVVVFRPFLDSGTIHRGVEGEIRLARTLRKKIIVFEPTEHGRRALREFDLRNVYSEEDEFYRACDAERPLT